MSSVEGAVRVIRYAWLLIIACSAGMFAVGASAIRLLSMQDEFTRDAFSLLAVFFLLQLLVLGAVSRMVEELADINKQGADRDEGA